MTPPAIEPPLAGPEPLVEAHAHFMHAGCGRADWTDVNAARLRAGERIGITCHVASILGSWGHASPIYFPAPTDVRRANDEMLALQRREGDRVRSYVVVNPNDDDEAVAEIHRCAALGAAGLKLAASRRADDPLLDPVIEAAVSHGFPVLHHVWQHRTRFWPGQDASDAREIVALASRHPRVNVILAHIGGGGDYAHTFAVVRDVPNVYLDVSGSGVDRGMLDDALAAVGAGRLIWGSDVTMETGLAKLRALEVIGLAPAELSLIRWGNARRIFPPDTFPAVERWLCATEGGA
jgi:predicted TIM-barrel fold metal-dependent hydrolase